VRCRITWIIYEIASLIYSKYPHQDFSSDFNSLSNNDRPSKSLPVGNVGDQILFTYIKAKLGDHPW
jgi:hypothetical protein